MVPFHRWVYVYPPRPGATVPFWDLARYGDGRWQAQLKLNGSRSIVVVDPDGKVDYWNRHKERHRAWTAPAWLSLTVRERFACGQWVVLDGELLHAKAASVKDTLYLFGALVLDGQYLVGETYGDCYAGLVGACGAVGADVPGYGGHVAEIGRGLWLARMIPPHAWRDAWGVQGPVIEGLVLKRMGAKLEPGRALENNGSWMIRCRKAKQ